MWFFVRFRRGANVIDQAATAATRRWNCEEGRLCGMPSVPSSFVERSAVQRGVRPLAAVGGHCSADGVRGLEPIGQQVQVDRLVRERAPEGTP